MREVSSAARMAAATPAGRDRYVDFLRVASLGVVIGGHWLMAVILVGPGGTVTATNILAVLPQLQPVTWLLQVMPVFFLVGGFSHASALDSLRRRGAGYADFVRTRAGRLLRSTAVFIGVWLVLALAIEVAGQDRGILRAAARTVAQPLWFIGVYLGVAALAPAMLRLHRSLGRWAAVVPATLAAATAAVDLARFAGRVPYVGYLNVAFVWLAVHQFGFLYADGTLRRGGRRLAGAFAILGLTATMLLTTFGPYPISMVGLPGDRVSNMSPPTLALLAHATWLTGLVLLLRVPVSRWLRRPRPWRYVVVGNGLAMTAFLWHLTALFAATALTAVLPVPRPAVGSPAWWLLRPLWIALLLLLTAGLVAVFRGADRARPARPAAARPAGARGGAAPAAVGVTLCTAGILGLSAVGFGGLLAGRTATLVILPVTPLLSSGVLAAGALLLRSGARLPGRSNPAGSQPAGSQPAGSQPAGSQPAGSHPAGSHRAGSRLAGQEYHRG